MTIQPTPQGDHWRSRGTSCRSGSGRWGSPIPVSVQTTLEGTRLRGSQPARGLSGASGLASVATRRAMKGQIRDPECGRLGCGGAEVPEVRGLTCLRRNPRPRPEDGCRGLRRGDREGDGAGDGEASEGGGVGRVDRTVAEGRTTSPRKYSESRCGCCMEL
jgi:hypothetical protein